MKRTTYADGEKVGGKAYWWVGDDLKKLIDECSDVPNIFD